jgi:hypothetical protein
MSEEWPEFRRWYELTMEEQRIYDEEDCNDHDRLLDAVDAKRQSTRRGDVGTCSAIGH